MTELIPPPRLAPLLPDDVTVDQCIGMWIDLVDTTDTLLLAGLRREVGPDGDLRAAYRQWNLRYRQMHEEGNARMLQTLRKFGG